LRPLEASGQEMNSRIAAEDDFQHVVIPCGGPVRVPGVMDPAVSVREVRIQEHLRKGMGR